MMNTFIAALDAWNGDDTNGENTQITALLPIGDIPAGILEFC